MFEVLKAEESITKTGKRLKRLMLEQEGKQYPIKNVTVWEDFDGFDDIHPGTKVSGDLLEKDSGTPNPYAPGKNYINRTLVAAKNPNGTTAPTGQGNIALESRLKRLEDKVFGQAETTPVVEYPENKGPIPFADDIDPLDSPF